jgi:hypothetical protein
MNGAEWMIWIKSAEVITRFNFKLEFKLSCAEASMSTVDKLSTTIQRNIQRSTMAQLR